MIDTDIGKRWANEIPHHPKSVQLMAEIQYVDFKYNTDYFRWKIGGDGDNGETLMYVLDLIFEAKEKKEKL